MSMVNRAGCRMPVLHGRYEHQARRTGTTTSTYNLVLHPGTYTLMPTPWHLHPSTYTLVPTPYYLHLGAYTLLPTP